MGQCLCKGVEPAIGTFDKGGDVNVARYQAQASVQKSGAPADGAVWSTSDQNSTVSPATQLGVASKVPGDDDQEASRLVVETRVNTIVENINRAAVVHDLVALIMTNVSKAASDDTLSDKQHDQTTSFKGTSTQVNSNVTATPAVACNSTTTASAPAPLATPPTYSTVVAAVPAAVQSVSDITATSQAVNGTTHLETRSAGLNIVSREISPLVDAAIDATVKPTAQADLTTSGVEATTIKAASDLTTSVVETTTIKAASDHTSTLTQGTTTQGAALSTGANGVSDTGSPSSAAGSPGLADSSDDIVQPTSSGGMSEASTTASVAEGKKKKRKGGKRHKRPPTSAAGDATSAATAASKVVASAAAPKPNGKNKTKAK